MNAYRIETSPEVDFQENACHNMIQQQIRPWSISDASVLDLMARVPRGSFAAPHLSALAYADFELPINVSGAATGESMLAPKVEARFLQALELHPHETVLQIGTGSGYLVSLLAHKAERVISLEIDPHIRSFAEANLNRAHIHNVQMQTANGPLGWPAKAPYDAVILCASVPALPEALLSQVKPGGRLLAVVGNAPVMQAQLIRRHSDGSYTTTALFETYLKPMSHAQPFSSFHF